VLVFYDRSVSFHLIHDLPLQQQHQQDEEYFCQHAGLKFEEKDIEMLHLRLSFMELKLEYFRTI
jgi:hypothetical protein